LSIATGLLFTDGNETLILPTVVQRLGPRHTARHYWPTISGRVAQPLLQHIDIFTDALLIVERTLYIALNSVGDYRL